MVRLGTQLRDRDLGMGISKLKKLTQSSQQIPEPAETMSGWMERYIVYLRTECHLAENTVQAYGRDLEHMKEWLKGRSPTKLKIDDLTDFVAYLKGQALAATTITRHVVAIRMFFKFLRPQSLDRRPGRSLLERPSPLRYAFSSRSLLARTDVRDGMPSLRDQQSPHGQCSP
jgi:site-specific recombinase XerC